MSLVPIIFANYGFSRVHILLITGKLNLNDNVLNGTIPTELGLLSNLTELDLESNQLTGTIPTSLASLPLLGKSQSVSS
jgi:hypothetical protein